MANNSIHKIRLKKGISIEYIASRMSVSAARVKSWEINCTNLTVKQAKMLSKLLGVTLDTMIFGNDIDQIDISKLDETKLIYIMRFVQDRLCLNDRKNGRLERNVIIEEQNDFGNSVKYVRVRLMGMTQNEFADVLSVSRETIKNWESKSECTSLRNLMLLSQVTGLAIDYFAYDNYPIKIPTNCLNEEKKKVIIGFLEYYKCI